MFAKVSSTKERQQKESVLQDGWVRDTIGVFICECGSLSYV